MGRADAGGSVSDPINPCADRSIGCNGEATHDVEIQYRDVGNEFSTGRVMSTFRIANVCATHAEIYARHARRAGHDATIIAKT